MVLTVLGTFKDYLINLKIPDDYFIRFFQKKLYQYNFYRQSPCSRLKSVLLVKFCSNRIQGEPGDTVQLDFDAFQLESGSCTFDYVAIFDGDNGQLGPNYCGSSIPPRTTSTGPVMIVVFVSDDSLVEFESRKSQ